MDSRQRFALAMRHQAADRVPLDIGGTSLTGMRPGCQARLRKLLGFTGQPAATWRGIDERLLEWIGSDFRSVGAIVSLPSPHTQALSATTRVDCWGIRRELVGGDWQITRHPLRDATVDDLAAFPWPEPRIDEGLLATWEAQAKQLRAEGRHVVVGEHPVFGILELGCWMCGYDDFLMRLAADPDFVLRFFDRVFAIQMRVIEQYYSVLGPHIDLTTSGDDFGGQNGPLISPRMFAALHRPLLRSAHRPHQAVDRRLLLAPFLRVGGRSPRSDHRLRRGHPQSGANVGRQDGAGAAEGGLRRARRLLGRGRCAAIPAVRHARSGARTRGRAGAHLGPRWRLCHGSCARDAG